MKKINYITTLLLIFAFFITGCKKEETILNDTKSIQQMIMQNEMIEMIPIAKLSEENEIVHLFLQKDVQDFFAKENPNQMLVFVEVMDFEKNGKEAGLLYRIYNRGGNITETSMSFLGLVLKEDIYYLPIGTRAPVGFTTTCTTSDCASETKGCMPNYYNCSCSPCANGGKCTRSTSNLRTATLTNLTEAIIYAISVY